MDRGLHALFEAQVDRTPDATAVIAGALRLSYRDLDERANRLAHRLVAAGVTAEDPVAFVLERDETPVIAILAILKAGGCYVPIDPGYPAERRGFILEDSRARLVITTGAVRPDLPSSVTAIAIDDDPAGGLSGRPAVAVDPAQLAYVIYTSGSTGRPKGSLVTHRNVMRLMSETAPWFGFGADDCWTIFHSFAFDFSVWEMWGALLYGGRAVVVPYLVTRSPEDMLDVISAHGVTVLNQTPSAFRQLAHAAIARGAPLPLRYIVFGGEALDVTALAPWFARFGDQRPALINMFGITETTVHVTYRPVGRDDVTSARSVIGRPIPDLALHVLDDAFAPVTTDAVGELYVGGAGLSRGYLGMPALTAQRFVPDPFSSEPGARLYRTGDSGRRWSPADVEYLGRVDFQIKIRGFRIEAGEIEHAVRSHPAVRDAVVIAREDVAGDQRLVAYVIARAPSAPPDLDGLRAHVRSTLPDYMIPSAVVAVDAFPLTTNGKLDRAALPAPEARVTATATATGEPRTALETWLATTWAELLRVPVGLDDTFFDLGGHSLLLTQLLARLRDELGVEVPLRTLFVAPTVRALAVALAGQVAEAEALLAEIEGM